MSSHMFTRDDGTEMWYQHSIGRLHRKDGPAILYPNGAGEEWWFNGLRHREDGPACDYSFGRKEWWFNGQRHNVSGPAYISPRGVAEWWLNDVEYDPLTWMIKVHELKNNA